MKAGSEGSLFDSVMDMLETVVSAVLFVVILFTFIIKIVTVSGESMEDTFSDGDKLLVRNLFYTPQQNDIVVVKSDVLDKLIIKRVIAVAGQKVVIDYNTDKIYVCDKNKEPQEEDALTEGYLRQSDMKDPESYFSESHYDENSKRYFYTVPVGYLFVLGDNRNESTDSRAIGLIDVNDVEGKAFFRFASPNGNNKLGFVG